MKNTTNMRIESEIIVHSIVEAILFLSSKKLVERKIQSCINLYSTINIIRTLENFVKLHETSKVPEEQIEHFLPQPKGLYYDNFSDIRIIKNFKQETEFNPFFERRNVKNFNPIEQKKTGIQDINKTVYEFKKSTTNKKKFKDESSINSQKNRLSKRSSSKLLNVLPKSEQITLTDEAEYFEKKYKYENEYHKYEENRLRIQFKEIERIKEYKEFRRLEELKAIEKENLNPRDAIVYNQEGKLIDIKHYNPIDKYEIPSPIVKIKKNKLINDNSSIISNIQEIFHRDFDDSQKKVELNFQPHPLVSITPEDGVNLQVGAAKKIGNKFKVDKMSEMEFFKLAGKISNFQPEFIRKEKLKKLQSICDDSPCLKEETNSLLSGQGNYFSRKMDMKLKTIRRNNSTLEFKKKPDKVVSMAEFEYDNLGVLDDNLYKSIEKKSKNQINKFEFNKMIKLNEVKEQPKLLPKIRLSLNKEASTKITSRKKK